MVNLPLASQHLDVKTIGRGGPLRRLFKPDKWTPLFACLSTVAGRTSGRRHWPIRCKGRRKDFSSCSLAIVAHAAWRRSMAGCGLSENVGQACCRVSQPPRPISVAPKGPGRYVAGTVWLTSAHKRDQVRCPSWVNRVGLALRESLPLLPQKRK